MNQSDIQSLEQIFDQALTAIQAHVDAVDLSSLAIAYSGGLDSAVLLHLAHAYAGKHGITLHAFHIHHGLSPNANQWLEHCRTACTTLGIAFDHKPVVLQAGGGVEEAARLARYKALGALCTQHDVQLLLTAHHLDDQAETVLLQLLRGSGIAGLTGMEPANRAPGMLGTDKVTIARPLLNVKRSELEDYARKNAITHVEDESNLDQRFARNALRHRVVPELAACFPNFQQRIARAAQHAQAAQGLLTELAAQDFAACRIGDALDLNRIRAMQEDRANNLLRYWFAQRGARMPSTAWLSEMRAQLLAARGDAELCVTHADCHIRRHRERVYMTPRRDETAERTPISFTWNGERALDFPAYGGALHFEAGVGVAGVDLAWLQGRACVLHYRQGGERLKLAVNRPTRDLKHHYQALDVPAWERTQLPMVSSGGKLLFAAGVGMDCSHFGASGVNCVRLRWQPRLSEPVR